MEGREGMVMSETWVGVWRRRVGGGDVETWADGGMSEEGGQRVKGPQDKAKMV